MTLRAELHAEVSGLFRHPLARCAAGCPVCVRQPVFLVSPVRLVSRERFAATESISFQECGHERPTRLRPECPVALTRARLGAADVDHRRCRAGLVGDAGRATRAAGHGGFVSS